MIELNEISPEEKARIELELAQKELQNDELTEDDEVSELLNGIAEIVASLITPHLMIIAERLGYKYPPQSKEFIINGLEGLKK